MSSNSDKQEALIQQYIEKKAEWSDELMLLNRIIRQLPFQLAIKWGVPVYQNNNKNLVSIGAFKEYIALTFFQGNLLSDPSNTLTNLQPGKTQHMRHWHFSDVQKIAAQESTIVDYLQEAISVSASVNKPPSGRKGPVQLPDVPEWLQQEFSSNSQLYEQFSKLAPHKQKDYLIFLTEPKRQATIERRFIKAKKLILQGQGLNDKYA